MHRSVLFGIIVVATTLLAMSLLGLLETILPAKIHSTVTPADRGLPSEEVTLMTSDGLKLTAWFLPHPEGDSTPALVLLHGYPADKGNVLPATAYLAEHFHLLYLDFRGLGESEGWVSTVGARETEDLLSAIRYLRSRGIDRIGVWGLSMGGAVALMTAPRAPEIAAIVSESSYARLDLLASSRFAFPVLKDILGALTIAWARLLLGIDARTVAPAESVRSIATPVLLIHSKRDEVIPFSHALLLREALKDNPHAEFWFPEELHHGAFTEEHRQKILEFFQRHL